jgi:hypothetical protein
VVAQVLESARRVERVSGEISEFVAARFEALEQALYRQRNDLAARASCQADSEQFARQRAQWEREQREALEKLEAEHARLTEAWGRLEAEQRKLLTDRAACERGAARTSSAPAAGHVGAEVALPSPHTAASQPPAAPATIVPDQASNQELERAVRESVLMQFQQLKNDVRSHARRRNSR